MSDDQRPLNKRGRRDAPGMAEWLRSNNLVPEEIFASTACRVEQTLQGMLPQWEQHQTPIIHQESELYLASASTLLSYSRRFAESTTVGMIVAHNPGLEMLVAHFGGPSYLPMPTAAVCIIRSSEADWSVAFQSGNGRCHRTVRPKEVLAYYASHTDDDPD